MPQLSLLYTRLLCYTVKYTPGFYPVTMLYSEIYIRLFSRYSAFITSSCYFQQLTRNITLPYPFHCYVTHNMWPTAWIGKGKIFSTSQMSSWWLRFMGNPLSVEIFLSNNCDNSDHTSKGMVFDRILIRKVTTMPWNNNCSSMFLQSFHLPSVKCQLSQM